MPSPRRLSEADTNFVVMGAATGAPAVPLSITVYERPYDDPHAIEHLTEMMVRLVPQLRQRVVTDPLSTALPTWEDVPGFDPLEHLVVLPAPGDGTLRAVLDWAEQWSRIPLPLDRPPWRSVHFEGVTVDGVPGRMVSVGQFHHALIDGQGATRLGEHFYQWAPDGTLPELPSPVVAPPALTPGQRWRAGWADEVAKGRRLATNTGSRLRFAARDPRAGLRRAKELAAAAQRLQASQGPQPLSPLLLRRSDRNRFDQLHVDLDALRAGARSLGASANDGLMAAVSLGLQRWHLDHGVRPTEVRMAMPISTRAADQDHHGNELVGVLLRLPLLDDAARAVKECQALSRSNRDDRDLLYLVDRFRAAGNRLPMPLARRLFGPAMRGLDVSLSNVKGMPVRSWVAGVEVLDSYAYLIGGPAVALTLISGPSRATLGMVTCPEAVPDPGHLITRLDQGIAEVTALAG